MFALDVIKIVWPKRGTTIDETYQWQQVIAAIVLTEGAMIMLLAALMFGWLTSFGFSGFVTDVQFKPVQQLLTEIRAGQLNNQIIAARVKQCIAIMEGNSEARISAFNEVQALLSDYAAVKGKDFRLPECVEIMPSNPGAPLAGPIPKK